MRPLPQTCPLHPSRKGDGCAACSAHAAAYMDHYRRRLYLGRKDRLGCSLQGSLRRIRALQVMGHSLGEIAMHAGLSKATVVSLTWRSTEYVQEETYAGIVRAFERLWDKPGRGRYAERIAAGALRKGWLPGAAWDDIDNDEAPPEVPVPTAVGQSRRGAIVLEEYAFLHSLGMSDSAIARKLGIRLSSLKDRIRRPTRPDRYPGAA